MGFSPCACFGSSSSSRRRPRNKDTVHRSYVRVVDVPPPYSDQHAIARMPEKMRSTASFEPLIEFSEKEVYVETAEERPVSSSSSIVSMPSTHLTSNPTGASSVGARNSLIRMDTGSTTAPPPSYRSASRSSSPVPVPVLAVAVAVPSTLLLHPVMSDDWFRTLQQRALDASTRAGSS